MEVGRLGTWDRPAREESNPRIHISLPATRSGVPCAVPGEETFRFLSPFVSFSPLMMIGGAPRLPSFRSAGYFLALPFGGKATTSGICALYRQRGNRQRKWSNNFFFCKEGNKLKVGDCCPFVWHHRIGDVSVSSPTDSTNWSQLTGPFHLLLIVTDNESNSSSKKKMKAIPPALSDNPNKRHQETNQFEKKKETMK